MNSENAIWLGDLAETLEKLGPANDRTRAAIARCLGFGLVATPATGTPPPVPGEPRFRPEEGAGAPRPPAVDVTPRFEHMAPEPVDHSAEITKVLVPLPGAAEPALTPPWEATEVLEPVSDRHCHPQLPFSPLLEPRWQREVLTALASTVRPFGTVDVARMVTAVASGQPVSEVWRKGRWSLGRGVQLLTDLGVGMEPFRADQIAFGNLLRSVVGPEGVAEATFQDCPMRGVYAGTEAVWGPYRPPIPGVPVIVLSDLGQGGPRSHPQRSRAVEWLRFAALLRQSQTQGIALTPYPPESWPGAGVAGLWAVYWDRSTTVSRIRAVLKCAGGD